MNRLLIGYARVSTDAQDLAAQREDEPPVTIDHQFGVKHHADPKLIDRRYDFREVPAEGPVDGTATQRIPAAEGDAAEAVDFGSNAQPPGPSSGNRLAVTAIIGRSGYSPQPKRGCSPIART